MCNAKDTVATLLSDRGTYSETDWLKLCWPAVPVPSHRESHLAEGHLHGPLLTQAGAGSTFRYVRSLSQRICSSHCFSEVSSHFLPASRCTFPPRSLQPPPSALIDSTKEPEGLVPYVLHANYSHSSYQNIPG